MISDKNTDYPLYFKFSHIIIGIIGVGYILFAGQQIIVPLLFSIIIAIVLDPLVGFLHRKRFNRVIAIIIAVVLALLFIVGLFYFIGSQVALFSDELPQLKQKLIGFADQAIVWISKHFNISTTKIDAWIATQKKEGMNNSTSMIGETLITLGSFFILVFLMPVYIFLFLYYKPLLLNFIDDVFSDVRHKTVKEVLHEIKSLIQSYLRGLMIEVFIVATLNSTGLFLLGIDYAILIGVIGALLNLVPYIGNMAATILPLILALATKEPIYAVYVLILYIVVQWIDNNFIVPKIVASKVKINALASIVVVLLGGAIWGVAGMFLSLPLIAICKVIFDRVDVLKPLGYLIGDNMPETANVKTGARKK